MVDIADGTSEPITSDDLDVFFDAFVTEARRHYEATGEHPPVLIALRGKAVLFALDAAQLLDGPGQVLLPTILRNASPELGIDGYFIVSETWQVATSTVGMTPEQIKELAEKGMKASDHPDKFEALTVWFVSKAVTPRYARVVSMRIANGKVMTAFADQRQKPDSRSGGIAMGLL